MAPMIERIFLVLSTALVGFFLLYRLASSTAIDTAFMIDTTYLAQLGWRGVNGLSPVVDYRHFRGGFTAANLTFAFQHFDVSMKSVDYAFILIFLEAAALLVLLSWNRLCRRSIAILLVVSAAIILGPLTIEDGYRAYVNHSFVYNHFAIVATMAVSIYVINSRTDSVTMDFLSGSITGVTLFVLALTKPTFIVIAPFVLVACAIRKDFRAVAVCVLGFLVALALLDPWGLRFRGSLEEITSMGLIERAGGLTGRFHQALLTVTAHAGYLLVLAYFAWLYGRGNMKRAFSLFASMFLCAAGFGAATLSMNGRPDLMMLPMIIALLTILSDRLAGERERMAMLGYLTATAMAAVLVLPAAYYSLATWTRADEAKLSQLITNGPLANYVVLSSDPSLKLSSDDSAEKRLQVAVSEAAKRLEAGGPNRPTDAYVVLADGFDLLSQISDVARYGIITRGSMFDFTVPLKSRPVPSFPVWPLKRSTSFLDMSEVDIVMSVRHYSSPDHLSTEAAAIVEQDFRPCRASTFFTLSVRRSISEITCTQTNMPQKASAGRPAVESPD